MHADVQRVRAVVEILRKRFPGLTITELLDLAETIATALPYQPREG